MKYMMCFTILFVLLLLIFVIICKFISGNNKDTETFSSGCSCSKKPKNKLLRNRISKKQARNRLSRDEVDKPEN